MSFIRCTVPPRPRFGKLCCAFLQQTFRIGATPPPNFPKNHRFPPQNYRKNRNEIFWIGNNPPPPPPLGSFPKIYQKLSIESSLIHYTVCRKFFALIFGPQVKISLCLPPWRKINYPPFFQEKGQIFAILLSQKKGEKYMYQILPSLPAKNLIFFGTPVTY